MPSSTYMGGQLRRKRKTEERKERKERKKERKRKKKERKKERKRKKRILFSCKLCSS